MKKTLLAVLLLGSALAWAADPDPAAYPINVHISSSRFTDRGAVRLEVIIDSKKYELAGVGYLLVPGDYKAKLKRDTHSNAYEVRRTYELLFPDNKTRAFDLNGIME